MSERDITNRLRRAVKENNIALVKRLIQRTDMRNPDPGPERYTSLAWAAVLGHEETFEYLLQMGHDDEELSKDSENNTILIILAGLGNNNVSSPYRSPQDVPDLHDAAMRMARQYWERFPFITDWSNLQGRTALHVAALKGSEHFVRMICDLGADVDLTDILGNTALHYASAWGHIPVVQLLIERGCAFNAKNNEGFTASDYAYSYNTQEALQETARAQWETNKKARAKQGGRSADARDRYNHSPEDYFDEAPPTRRILQPSRNRLRSGSATTSASDSTDYEGQLSTSAPIHGSSGSSSQFSSHSSGSLPRAPPSNGTVLTPIPSSSQTGSGPSTARPRFRSHQSSSSASTTNTHSSKPSLPSAAALTSGRVTPQNVLGVGGMPTSVSSISPFAARMLERDADAMAQYLARHRSGSNSSIQDMPTATTTYVPQQTSPILSEATFSDARSRTLPRLKPSISATSLRPGSQATTPTATRHPGPSITQDDSRTNPRIRATTLNTVPGRTVVTNSPPMHSATLPGGPGSPSAQWRQGFTLPLGRAAENAQAAMYPSGGTHGRRPSGSLLKEIAAMRIDTP